MVEEGEKLGASVNLFTTTTFDRAKGASQFNAAMLSHPDGLLSATLPIDTFNTQYQQLMNEGVPVITSDETKPTAQYQVLWTQPTEPNSPFLPEVLELVPDVEGSMAVLGGVEGLEPVTERSEPLVAAIAEARPKLEELPTYYSNFDTNKATQYVRSTLINHPDLKVIVAADGPDAIGVVAALKAAGKAGDVTVISLDATPPQVEALEQGVIAALIAQPAREIGADIVETLVDYIEKGESGPVPASSKFVGVPQQILTQKNVGDPASKELFYVTDCGEGGA